MESPNEKYKENNIHSIKMWRRNFIDTFTIMDMSFGLGSICWKSRNSSVKSGLINYC